MFCQFLDEPATEVDSFSSLCYVVFMLSPHSNYQLQISRLSSRTTAARSQDLEASFALSGSFAVSLIILSLLYSLVTSNSRGYALPVRTCESEMIFNQ